MKYVFVILLFVTAAISFAWQQPNLEYAPCTHYHFDNPTAQVPCDQTIHFAKNIRITDYSKVQGKLSFKLNGQYYEMKQDAVSCYNQPRSAKAGNNIVQATWNNDDMVYFSYNYFKSDWLGSSSTKSPNKYNGNFTIVIDNKSYSTWSKLNEEPTKFEVNVVCAHQYGTNQYLLNGSFSGELKEKETGTIVKISDGKFCSAPY
jgi:hypothetical protein